MIYSIICSRRDRPPINFNKVLTYFQRAGIKWHVEYDPPGIFEGYEKALSKLELDQNDIVILCHDDIQIFNDPLDFSALLTKELSNTSVGFVGPAGTTYLDNNAVWWDAANRSKGLHRGFVFQGSDPNTMTPNYFGPHGNVVVLDGLFLAARKFTLDLVGIKKPGAFKNGWDFYDLVYTVTAYEEGLFNKTIPIILTHYSNGEMRSTWNENRIEFMKMFRFPIRCK